MSSLLLKLIGENRPLHTWETYAAAFVPEPESPVTRRLTVQVDWSRGKEVSNIARKVVSALTHPSVIRLVTNEWELLPPALRIKITEFANDSYRSPSSHNLAKNIKKLDNELGGKILSKAQGPTERDLRVVGGSLVSRNRRVRQNVAGAERAFGAFTTPKDFNQWDPARKRRFREQMAQERRQGKK